MIFLFLSPSLLQDDILGGDCLHHFKIVCFFTLDKLLDL